MKFIKKEVNISFGKGENIYGKINEVVCDKKNLFYKIMFVLSILFAFLCIYIIGIAIYPDFVGSDVNINLSNIISVCLLIIFFISPAFYFYMEIVNFKFFINDKEFIYINLFGKKFNYSIDEIISTKYYASIGEETIDSIHIKLINKKRIILTATNRNFYKLKYFLISKGLIK